MKGRRQSHSGGFGSWQRLYDCPLHHLSLAPDKGAAHGMSHLTYHDATHITVLYLLPYPSSPPDVARVPIHISCTQPQIILDVLICNVTYNDLLSGAGCNDI